MKAERRARGGTFLHESGEHAYLSYPIDREPSSTQLPSTLTDAEAAVVALVIEGASSAEIARARGKSQRTIANQLSSAYRKLGVSSRASLLLALHTR